MRPSSLDNSANDRESQTAMNFEDEFPEEAKTLAEICGCPQVREAVKEIEVSLPRDERIYQFTGPGSSKPWMGSTTITRSSSKVGRNDPCPCLSGKKWKRCCGK